MGWLFQVRSGSVYYQDGPVGIRYRYHQAAPGDIAEKVLSLLTSRHDPDKLQKGTIYPVIGVNVSALGGFEDHDGRLFLRAQQCLLDDSFDVGMVTDTLARGARDGHQRTWRAFYC